MRPVIGQFYKLDDKVFRVVAVSQGTDEITLLDTATGGLYTQRYATFQYSFIQVWKVTEVAKMLSRAPRSIYWYEANGIINKPFTYPNRGGRMVRYYTRQDILEARDMIANIAQGAPRKRKTNNTIIDPGSLQLMLRERFGPERKDKK